jgi:hypothetical protein
MEDTMKERALAQFGTIIMKFLPEDKSTKLAKLIVDFIESEIINKPGKIKEIALPVYDQIKKDFNL